MKINLQAKDLISTVHYQNPIKDITQIKEDIDFLNQKVSKEVKKSLSKRITTPLTLSLIPIMPMIASAEEIGSVANELPSIDQLIKTSQWLIQYSTVGIIAVGVAWIAVTRILNFIPNEKYKKWSIEITTGTIRGITEVITIPMIIYILIGIATILFGGVPGFNLPF